jgi:uncharacterized protein YndB with AHSA1/START domain
VKFTNTIRIERPAREVFAYLAQLERIPEWNYAISRTWKVSDGPVGKGSKYRQQRTVPNRGEEDFMVTEFSPDDRLAISGTLGPFAAHLTYTLVEDGNVTVLTNDVTLQPSGLLRVVAPFGAARIKEAVARNLDALKQILE